MHILEWLLLVQLVIVFPAWELLTGGKLRARLQRDPSGKIAAYRLTCIQLWLPTLVLLGLFVTGSLSVSHLPLLTQPDRGQLLAAVAIVLLAVYLLASLRRVANDPDLRRQTADALQPQSWILPTDRREAAWFVGPVSVSAGICEELLYRGYLIQYLDAQLPLWAAVLLSSLLFGVLHAYQGIRGMLRTAAAGLLLSLLFVGTGSLLLPILLHVLVDAYAGSLSWVALKRDAPQSAGPAKSSASA